MSGVKTAISLDEELFNEVNTMAHQLKISRSKLFVLAIRDFLKKKENQTLLEKLNAAYTDSQDEELEMTKKMKKSRTSVIEHESW